MPSCTSTVVSRLLLVSMLSTPSAPTVSSASAISAPIIVSLPALIVATLCAHAPGPFNPKRLIRVRWTAWGCGCCHPCNKQFHGLSMRAVKRSGMQASHISLQWSRHGEEACAIGVPPLMSAVPFTGRATSLSLTTRNSQVLSMPFFTLIGLAPRRHHACATPRTSHCFQRPMSLGHPEVMPGSTEA